MWRTPIINRTRPSCVEGGGQCQISLTGKSSGKLGYINTVEVRLALPGPAGKERASVFCKTTGSGGMLPFHNSARSARLEQPPERRWAEPLPAMVGSDQNHLMDFRRFGGGRGLELQTIGFQSILTSTGGIATKPPDTYYHIFKCLGTYRARKSLENLFSTKGELLENTHCV